MDASNHRNLYILTFTLFVVMLGYGVIIPILPFYIENMGAGGTELGLLTASYAVMRLIFGPIWGGFSDRVGRKPVLLVGIAGYVVTMVWFGLATELWMLFAARILSGILSSATAPTTMAYIGDSTPGDERGGGMGMLGAAAGIGTIFGPVLGGFLADASLAMPFFVAAGMALLSFVLAAIFLPESLQHEARLKSKSEEKIIDLNSWREAIFSPIGNLLLLTFVCTCGLMIFASVFGLYALEQYDFGPDDVGLMMMVLGLVSALTQGILAGPLTKRWGEGAVIKFSILGTALGFVFLLLANTYLTIFISTAFFALMTALQVPALTSLTSRQATVAQGVAMGLSNSFISLGRIVGPIWGGVSLDLNPALPYLSGGFVMLIGFGMSMIWMPKPPAETHISEIEAL
jgi:DHA1 family multidrug resistance protein-like MFS transporter